MTSPLDYDNAYDLRCEMVADQLEYRGIEQKNLLKAFKDVPRHLFIPNISLEEAYQDNPIPIKAGQTISQPYVVALMLTYLELEKNNDVLEIGSGSGYATAILSHLCKQVDAMEVFSELIIDAKSVIEKLSLQNISMFQQSAWEQLKTTKVYDRIILWASPPKVPRHLFDNLKEGGIMVTPEGKNEQYVWIYKKKMGKIEKQMKDAVRFVPLVQGSAAEIDSSMRG
jgi:protein-L-isoaspartate(D-aspartate) O-methyltransferase